MTGSAMIHTVKAIRIGKQLFHVNSSIPNNLFALNPFKLLYIL